MNCTLPALKVAVRIEAIKEELKLLNANSARAIFLKGALVALEGDDHPLLVAPKAGDSRIHTPLPSQEEYVINAFAMP